MGLLAALAVGLLLPEVAQAALTLFGVSSNPQLVPNERILCWFDGTNHVISIQSVSNQTGTAVINLYVTDGNTTARLFPISQTKDVLNLPPVVVAPARISSSVNSMVPLTGLAVSDPDAENEPVTLTVQVDAGALRLALGVPGGLTADHVVSSDATSLSVHASIAQINATLAAPSGLTYLPPTNHAGAALLTMSVNDNGNIGAGGARTTSSSTRIQIAGNTLQTWRSQFFTVAELGDASAEATLWGAHADPDGDTWDNLMEFALGLNPRQPDSSEEGLISGLIDWSGTRYLVLTFARRKHEPLLQYVPEVSSDKTTWQSGEAAMQAIDVIDVNDGFEVVTFQDTTSVLPGRARFARLRVINHGL